MKIIVVCIAVAVAGFWGAHKYLENPAVWRSPHPSRASTGGKDLRVDTQYGKMYPGLPKFESVRINGKQYLKVTTVKSVRR